MQACMFQLKRKHRDNEVHKFIHLLNSFLEDVLGKVLKINFTSIIGNTTAYLNFCCSGQLT